MSIEDVKNQSTAADYMKHVKYPAEYYFQTKQQTFETLGFKTPYAKNSAFRGRKETILKWAMGSYSRHIYDPVLRKSVPNPVPPPTFADQFFKNELRTGFKILGKQRRYSTQNVLWRVEDPDGIVYEISSENLSHLLLFANIKAKEILDGCVWIRQGQNDVLIPETSPIWEFFLKNASYD